MTFRNQEVFYSVGLSAMIGVGTGFVLFGLAMIYDSPQLQAASNIVGGVSITVGFVLYGWGLIRNRELFGRVIQSKQRVYTFQPIRNDNFSIVIDGIGSFGNPESQTDVDTIARNAVRELVTGGNTIRIARMYSRNGSQNLLVE
ncbi:MAG: hypothetical protein ACREAW_06415 [Nitrososphaera sp.]